jgi:hypothetical protein
MRITKNSQPIRDLDHWGIVAGPKGSNQWVAGRSAMEAARYWLGCGDSFPAELAAILKKHEDFGTIATWSAEPEVQLAFDNRRGEPRNTDLLVVAEDDRGGILMAVEAKADESFGALIPDAMVSALESKLKNPRSQALDRIEDLVRTLFRPKERGHPGLSRIRYQLLTATAGLLAEATRRKIGRAVLVIQEFCSGRTDDEVQTRNGVDLDAFLQRVTSAQVRKLSSGDVVGPLPLQDGSFAPVNPALYVLKQRCDLRRGV